MSHFLMLEVSKENRKEVKECKKRN
jgi:hypothetical protein